MNIQVTETIPGLGAARQVQAGIDKLGIPDIQLFFDKQLKMWAVVQVRHKDKGLIYLPKTFNETSLEPYLLWWCKSEQDARYREPNTDDLANIVKMVTQAPEIWAKGEKRADEFDAKDAEKDRKHKEKFHDKIHTIAPSMKRALQKGNL